MDESGQPSSGILASLRRLADTVLSTVQNRVELFAVELEEERRWFFALLIWAAAAVFCGALAITAVTVTVVWLVSPENRPQVLLFFCLLFVAIAVAAALIVRKKIKDKPPALSDTISELKKDIAWLRSKD